MANCTYKRVSGESLWSGTCGYIDAGLLRAALTCLLCAALTCPIRAPRACVVLDSWSQGIAWQRSPARCLLPCICALCEKEHFQLFHFIQPLKMVHFRCFSFFFFCLSLCFLIFSCFFDFDVFFFLFCPFSFLFFFLLFLFGSSSFSFLCLFLVFVQYLYFFFS